MNDNIFDSVDPKCAASAMNDIDVDNSQSIGWVDSFIDNISPRGMRTIEALLLTIYEKHNVDARMSLEYMYTMWMNEHANMEMMPITYEELAEILQKSLKYKVDGN